MAIVDTETRPKTGRAKVTVKELKGKAVLLFFWATW